MQYISLLCFSCQLACRLCMPSLAFCQPAAVQHEQHWYPDRLCSAERLQSCNSCSQKACSASICHVCMDPCLCMTAKPRHSLVVTGRPMAPLHLLECSLCMALEGACRTSVGAHRKRAACVGLALVKQWKGRVESVDTQLGIAMNSRCHPVCKGYACLWRYVYLAKECSPRSFCT